MAPRTQKRDVSFIKLVDPKFLSLVKSPANRTGFKVIRQDDGSTKRIRQRFLSTRSDTSSLLAITLPSGITEDEATELMEYFNLGDDYSLYTTDDGDFVLRRQDAENAEFPRQIEMGNGFGVLVEGSVVRSDNAISGVTLTAMTFEVDTMDEVRQTHEWLKDVEIDHYKEEDGKVYVAFRSSEEEGRTVNLGEGITGTVIRSKETDVPLPVYRSVLEESYGNWGWGQLDFSAALAGPEFENKSWDALYVLRNVLENIILYSELPLDDRKTLVENACEQFASYIGGLLEALPKGLIEKAISRNDETVIQEAGEMAKSTKTDVKRDDQTSEEQTQEATAAPEATSEESTQESEFVTRSELGEVVKQAVADAMEEHVTRSDETTDKVVSAVDKLGEAVGKINENVESVTRSMKTMQEEVDALGGETVARSDEDETAETETEQETVERSENASPFTGMFASSFK